jgi:hypothetical protein
LFASIIAESRELSFTSIDFHSSSDMFSKGEKVVSLEKNPSELAIGRIGGIFEES